MLAQQAGAGIVVSALAVWLCNLGQSLPSSGPAFSLIGGWDIFPLGLFELFQQRQWRMDFPTV